ncbi:MAG TPA: hypothetical protein VLL52_19705, partial [Anaerolineae bacterium]|nr:hypothetical protein [Anaerolineae bacterium]
MNKRQTIGLWICFGVAWLLVASWLWAWPMGAEVAAFEGEEEGVTPVPSLERAYGEKDWEALAVWGGDKSPSEQMMWGARWYGEVVPRVELVGAVGTGRDQAAEWREMRRLVEAGMDVGLDGEGVVDDEGVTAEVTELLTGTLTVGDGCQYGTLQAAVTAAASGATILMQGKEWVGSGATANITSKTLVIEGGYNAGCSQRNGSRTVLNGTGVADSVIEILGSAGWQVTLINIDLTGGSSDSDYGGGLELSADQTVVLSNTRVYSNSSVFGGGIHMTDGALQLRSGSLVYRNEATVNGGGIFCQSGVVTVREGSGVGYWFFEDFGNVADADSDGLGSGGGLHLDGCVFNLNATDGQTVLVGANDAYLGGG